METFTSSTIIYGSFRPLKLPSHRHLPQFPPTVNGDHEDSAESSFQLPGEFPGKRIYLPSRSPYTNCKRFRLLQLFAQLLGYTDLVFAFGFLFYLMIPTSDVPMDNYTIAFLFGSSWNIFSSIILYMGVHKKRILEFVKLWFITQFIMLAYGTILFTKDMKSCSLKITIVATSTYVHKLMICSYMVYYTHYVWTKQMKEKAIDILQSRNKV